MTPRAVRVAGVGVRNRSDAARARRSPRGTKALAPDDENRLAEIVRQQVEPVVGRHGQMGLVVGVIAGDEEVLLGFGSRRLGDSTPPDADTRFEIGSITKVFTGILLAERIESGELELDSRVAELLPEG